MSGVSHWFCASHVVQRGEIGVDWLFIADSFHWQHIWLPKVAASRDSSLSYATTQQAGGGCDFFCKSVTREPELSRIVFSFWWLNVGGWAYACWTCRLCFGRNVQKKKKTTNIYACATIPHSEGICKLFSARLFLLVFSRIRPRRAVSRTEGFEKPGWLICFTHVCFAHKTSPSEISE